MKTALLIGMLALFLGACANDPIPMPPPTADSFKGLTCSAPATRGCAACQVACIGKQVAVCYPGTDGDQLQEGIPPFCYRNAQCTCR
jgi:hypothetical protein